MPTTNNMIFYVYWKKDNVLCIMYRMFPRICPPPIAYYNIPTNTPTLKIMDFPGNRHTTQRSDYPYVPTSMATTNSMSQHTHQAGVYVHILKCVLV